MKVACLISGLPRSFQYNVDKIKKLLGEYTDYFVHITTDYKDQYKNKDTDYNKIISTLNPIQVVTEKDLVFEDTKYINVKKQWYKFGIINKLRAQYEKINGFKYDLVIRMRPDVYLLDNDIKFNNIKDEVIYGNNDQLFYGSSKTFNELNDLAFEFDNIIKYADTEMDVFFHYLKQRNIELINIDLNYKLILTECNIIAICGDSGSGKSTLIEYIDKMFKEKTLKIEGDRYHKWERGDPHWNEYTHLNPKANYICKLKEDTFNLKIGENIYQVDYNHSTGKFTNKQLIKSSKNIIICGLHTLYDDYTNKILNLKIFLDTDKNLKYYWKIKRDISERGYTVEKVLEKIKQREKDNIEFIEPQKFNSDIILGFFTDNDFNYKILDKKPNIYLKITSAKDCLDFIRILDKYNIDYSIQKYGNKISIIFYKIQDNFNSVLLYYSKNEINIWKNDYFTIIIAFLLFYN
tara:strand:- start:151 stop:1539 length:1389 start_codon:yes stop_codon:yes gene_type:complete